MLTANGLFAGGGFIFRMGKAVSVSLVGMLFAFIVMFFLVSAMLVIRDLLPSLQTAPFKHVAPATGDQDVWVSWVRWFDSFIFFAVPALVTTFLLLRDARPWLQVLAALLMIIVMANGLFHLVPNVLRSGVPIGSWPAMATDAAATAALGSVGFAWLQVSFARLILWSTGDKSA